MRQHPSTKDWYLLDSENSAPILLTDLEWGQLKGSMSVFAAGSAYCQNHIHGARDEGYTQVVDIEPDYITPGNVIIAKQPTQQVRMRTRQQGARQETYNRVQNCKRLERKSAEWHSNEHLGTQRPTSNAQAKANNKEEG